MVAETLGFTEREGLKVMMVALVRVAKVKVSVNPSIELALDSTSWLLPVTAICVAPRIWSCDVSVVKVWPVVT